MLAILTLPMVYLVFSTLLSITLAIVFIASGLFFHYMAKRRVTELRELQKPEVRWPNTSFKEITW